MNRAAQLPGHAGTVIKGVTVTPGIIAAAIGALLGLAAICWLARALLHMARLARAQGQAPAAPAASTGGKGRTVLAAGGIVAAAGWLYEKATTHPGATTAAAKPAAPAPPPAAPHPAVPAAHPAVPHAITQAHPLLSGWQIVIIIAVLAVAAIAAWANRSR